MAKGDGTGEATLFARDDVTGGYVVGMLSFSPTWMGWQAEVGVVVVVFHGGGCGSLRYVLVYLIHRCVWMCWFYGVDGWLTCVVQIVCP